MFGMSLTKILLTLAVGLAVWAFYRVLVRRRAIPELDPRTRLKAAWRGAIRPDAAEGAISLVRCPRCGDHVAPGTGCRRDGCPIAA